MKLNRSMQICISSAILLLITPIKTIAQTSIAAAGTNHQAISQVQPLTSVVLPNALEVEPILPEPQAETVRLVLRRGERRLYVYRGESQIASYPVAVGRPGWETPLGRHKVIQMIEHPSWQNPFTGEVVPPGSDNPLGDRWIGFWTNGTNYIGFHGTPNRESVGRAASHGCVRLYNEHIRELFTLVTMGTTVTVEP